MPIGVLYVDDEENNLISFRSAFRLSFTIYTAQSAEEGCKLLKRHNIGVIITDQRMPVTTGIEFIESIVPLYPDTIRILLTGFADNNTVAEAINRGHIYKYLVKPWQNEELKIHIQNAIEIYELRRENKELAYKLYLANQQLELVGKM